MTYTFLGNDSTVKDFAKNKFQFTRIWFVDGTYGEYDLEFVDTDVLGSIFTGGGLYWSDPNPCPTKIKFGTKVRTIYMNDFFSRCPTISEIYIPYTCESFEQGITFSSVLNGKLFCGCDSFPVIYNCYYFSNLLASELHLAITKDQAQQIFNVESIGKTCKVICPDGEFTVG